MNVSGPRRVATALAATGLAVIAIASCSSGKSGSKTTPPPTSPGTTRSGTSSGAPSTADAATVAAVTNAYAKLFAPNTPEAVSISLLQDGAAFKSALKQQGTSQLAQNSAAKVSKVTLQSPNTAKVVFTILVNGKAMLTDQPGYAVRQNGTWKVAGRTFCALLTLQGSPPPACSTPAATSLPD